MSVKKASNSTLKPPIISIQKSRKYSIHMVLRCFHIVTANNSFHYFLCYFICETYKLGVISYLENNMKNNRNNEN